MNETKIDILKCLFDGNWWTTTEVAQQCGLSLTNASELLHRYSHQSLVNRQRRNDVPRGYWYRLTDIGMDRLDYLSSDEMKTSQVIADRAGLYGAKKRALDRLVKQRLGR